MARGYPDFSGATMFPARKHFRVLKETGVIDPGPGIRELFRIDGQAIIDGGYVEIIGTADILEVYMSIKIDGQIIIEHSLSNYITGQRFGPHNYPIFISYLNEETLKATLMIGRNYYCGYEYIIYNRNLTGANITLIGNLLYSDVQ